MGLLYKSDLSADGRKGDSKKTAVAPEKNVEKKIAAYIARHPKLLGVVFDVPHGVTREEAEMLSGLIENAVSSIGIAVKLPSKRTLVLTPASIDKDLVSHRIRANFQIKNCRTFSMITANDIKAIMRKY